MQWLNSLIYDTASMGHILLLYALVIALGGILGKLKVHGVGFGATIVLFVGIVAGHFGLTAPAPTISYIQHFGLILFVTCIGLQVGPTFFSSFKRGGAKMVGATALLILLNVITVLGIQLLFFEQSDMPMLIGMMCGSITNTPSLGAAQEVLSQIGYTGEDIATGYACAYPFAVIGAIMSLVLLKLICGTGESESGKVVITEDIAVQAVKEAVASGRFPRKDNSMGVVITIFVTMIFGILLGSIPIPIHGCPVPAKLGLAGGPLVAAIFMGRFGTKVHLDTQVSASANHLLRDLGLCLFFASVGIKAGAGFVDSIVNGDGLWYMLFGFVVAVVPLLIVGLVCNKVFGFNYHQTSGILAGSCTAPHSLAFATTVAGNRIPATTYSMVYPFAMFLRIIVAQLLVLLLCC